MAESWRVLGRGGGESAGGGVLRAMSGWRGGRWRVAGCCTPCRGGVGVSGRWRGVARHVGVAWGSVAGGGVLRAVSGWRGGRWRLGLACRVEAAWRVGGVLHVVLRQHGGLAVAGCCVPYWGGVVAGWWSGCCVPCWGGGGVVLRVMSGRHAGGRLEMTRMLKAAAISCNVQAVALRAVLGRRWGGVTSHVGAACWGRAVVDDSRARGGGNSLQRSGRGIVSHVGAVCWGGDKWRWLTWLTCTRGRQWPAALKPWGWSAWNNGVVVREESFPGNESTTHIPTPQIKPPLDTMYHILSHTQTPSLVDAPPFVHVSCLHLSLPQYAATANPPRRPNTARKTFDPMPFAHAFRAGEPLPSRHRQPTALPQHNTQDLHCQPTTTPPQHGRQRPATPNPHATLTRANPAIRRLTACRPNTARQDPADPPRRLNMTRKTPPTRHAPSTRHTRPQPPPTPTPR
ncbi:hypothetical protein EDB86DRAFT_2823965 [Lactarius hatsudake]|nr:hypothetical protein EDB86DRAFT_2823965 [Lactarius hatsudake]